MVLDFRRFSPQTASAYPRKPWEVAHASAVCVKSFATGLAVSQERTPSPIRKGMAGDSGSASSPLRSSGSVERGIRVTPKPSRTIR